MQRLEVGQPFPGPVPPNEGAVLDITTSGLTMLAQAPGLRPDELRAFQAGAHRVCVLAAGPAEVPLCVVIVDWPGPLGPMDMSLNARLVRSETLASWLDTNEGVKNTLQVYLLDGRIVKGIKLMGLHPDMIQKMHSIILDQLAQSYSRADYERELAVVFQQSTAQLLGKATCYSHKIS